MAQSDSKGCPIPCQVLAPPRHDRQVSLPQRAAAGNWPCCLWALTAVCFLLVVVEVTGHAHILLATFEKVSAHLPPQHFGASRAGTSRFRSQPGSNSLPACATPPPRLAVAAKGLWQGGPFCLPSAPGSLPCCC